MTPAPVHSPLAVSVTELTRSFGETTAVDRVSFEVARGELFGIVGPDGAGKTTTLRMLAGVMRPTSGRATIEGIHVTDDPERAKPLLAYMAQRFGLYQDLTVRENLDFYADLYRVPRSERPARLERLYRFSRLGEFERRLAGNLSGGMKQKLALSCALIHQPRVLLLDEPTFGVDPISRRKLWIILHEMVASGITVLVSTSYLDEAERCDRLALLHHGRILALDTPDALLRRLPGVLLEVRSPAPRQARELLLTLPGIVSAALFGDTLHVLAQAQEAWGAALKCLEEEGVPLEGTRVLEPGLEDVFLFLVQGPQAHSETVGGG